jgi:hypothetical protein
MRTGRTAPAGCAWPRYVHRIGESFAWRLSSLKHLPWARVHTLERFHALFQAAEKALQDLGSG